MLSWIVGSFLPDIVGFLAPALAVLAAIFGVRWMGKKEARAEVRADQAEDTLKRTDAGRKAGDMAQDEIAKGKTPAEVVRDNDGRWGQ